MPLYAHYGVEYIWLVDPDLKTLEAYHLQRSTAGSKWLLLETLTNDQVVSLPPFDAIEFELSILWG
jgi:Uma2 family endonuclease